MTFDLSYFRQEGNSFNYNQSDCFITYFGTLTSGIVTAQSRFQAFLYGIIIPQNVHFKSSKELLCNESLQVKMHEFKEWLSVDDNSPKAFGKFKYYLDSFFYDMTEKGKLEYRYIEEYLITPTRAAVELNVTRQSINNYIRLGLEAVVGSKHKKIPLHVHHLWKDPIWATKIQVLHGLYKLREQYSEEKYLEVIAQIHEYEKEYKGKFEIVFKDIIDGLVEWDDLDYASDYLKWRNLEEEKMVLEAKIGLN